MTAAEVFTVLEEAGVSLVLDDRETLVAKPKTAVTAEMVTLLKEHKLEMVAALRRRERAAARGLTAKWSRELGYISLHDPLSGEWRDIATDGAPDWSRWEARKRKELWKAGNRHAFDVPRAQMEEIWVAEHPPEEQGIVEEYPPEEEEGGI